MKKIFVSLSLFFVLVLSACGSDSRFSDGIPDCSNMGSAFYPQQFTINNQVVYYELCFMNHSPFTTFGNLDDVPGARVMELNVPFPNLVIEDGERFIQARFLYQQELQRAFDLVINDDLSGVTMQAENHIFSLENPVIPTVIFNDSPHQISFGTFYELEIYLDNHWYHIPLGPRIAFAGIGLGLESGDYYLRNRNLNIFESIIFELTTGFYRIRMSVNPWDSNFDEGRHDIVFEFYLE